MLSPRRPRSIFTGSRLRHGWRVGLVWWSALGVAVVAQAPPEEGNAAPAAPTFSVQEYRVRGSTTLPPLVVEKAVYPFLGPGRTVEDVEGARAALEKAFRDQGYQTVAVDVPAQDPRTGVIVLEVSENPLGRVRVRGARYFAPSVIKQRATALAEGRVVNFQEVTKDIVRLNQWPDLQVTPELKPGAKEGTVDLDLVVKDTLPLHGSIELNNRYSADTTELRLNGSISYNNLWQRGHGVGFNFQVAPENTDDAKVYSAYYLARFLHLDWLSLLLQATKQDSNISTLGGVAVAGRGEIVGLRAIIALPSSEKFFQSVSLGADYKHFDENILIGGTELASPVTYYPLSVNYGATWFGKGHSTELNAGLNFHVRGVGNDSVEFENKRYQADTNYLYLRGDLTHTHDLPGGAQVAVKIQGQASSQPLINSEQFAAGGLGTVRGYLESAVLADNALLGSLELRSPSFVTKAGEWRVYAFVEGGRLTLHDALPEQEDDFDLASVGIGTRFKLWNHLGGSFDLGFPLIDRGTTRQGEALATFRLWAEF